MSAAKTILVIDNNKAFTDLIEKFLKTICGYGVKVVPDGYNGILTAKKTRPDLILLDVRMPAMNGLGILEKLKSESDTAAIPVIVITGFDDYEVKKRALELKALDYLVKPIDLELLRDRIAAVFNK